MNRRQREALARRAKAEVGQIMRAEVVCLECGAHGEKWYRTPPHMFRCDLCGKRAVVRDDDQPYPPAPEPLPV